MFRTVAGSSVQLSSPAAAAKAQVSTNPSPPNTRSASSLLTCNWAVIGTSSSSSPSVRPSRTVLPTFRGMRLRVMRLFTANDRPRPQNLCAFPSGQHDMQNKSSPDRTMENGKFLPLCAYWLQPSNNSPWR